MFLTSEDASGESGRAVIKHSAIARAKVRIDTRRWAMSKMAPKKYGDKLQNELTGKDGGPVEIENTADNAIIPAREQARPAKKDGFAPSRALKAVLLSEFR